MGATVTGTFTRGEVGAGNTGEVLSGSPGVVVTGGDTGGIAPGAVRSITITPSRAGAPGDRFGRGLIPGAGTTPLGAVGEGGATLGTVTVPAGGEAGGVGVWAATEKAITKGSPIIVFMTTY